MKLFTVTLGYGIATVAAKDQIGAMLRIAEHPHINFVDASGKTLPAKEMLEYIEEIKGCTIDIEEERVLNWYQE